MSLTAFSTSIRYIALKTSDVDRMGQWTHVSNSQSPDDYDHTIGKRNGRIMGIDQLNAMRPGLVASLKQLSCTRLVSHCDHAFSSLRMYMHLHCYC
ncbi:hypothetical protein Y032_0028g1825 [Ancylostoma ceylanicum]|uniref:Uncharacterized protein n=1 Tax=Ancylostoma ceylanicum TaxID=53326 RepID=A0A016UT36_9BILA|nr:hypothetical protein Y032_0028g1825 [Ancylostoma ceylanicum]